MNWLKKPQNWDQYRLSANSSALRKTVRSAIKQDLSQDFDPLDYAISGVLESKTNATSHSNIGSVKSSIGEWKNVWSIFWRHADHAEGVLIL